jgi:hypothetical protein
MKYLMKYEICKACGAGGVKPMCRPEGIHGHRVLMGC